MSIKLKKGINPKGTTHDIPSYAGKTLVKLRYKVSALLGVAGNMPSDGAVVYLTYAGGPVPGGIVPPFQALPLEVFVKSAVPVEKEDFFW